MTLLQFPHDRSSPRWSALEETIRDQLRPVLTSSLDGLAHAVLSGLSGELSSQQVEECIHAEVGRIGCEAMRVGLEASDVDVRGLERDGLRYFRAGRAKKTILCSLGPVTYERTRYRRRSGETLVPADERMPVVNGFYTPLAARRAALVLTLASVQETERLLAELGEMRPSSTALDNLMRAMAPVFARLEEGMLNDVRRRESEEALDVAEREDVAAIVISIDGVMVNMRARNSFWYTGGEAREAGYREASVGTVSLYGQAHEPGCPNRLRTVYFGRMPESKKVAMKRDLEAEVRHALSRHPTAEMAFVADGAPDNWRYASSTFPDALQIFDAFHAMEHLKKCRRRGIRRGRRQGALSLPEAPGDPPRPPGRHRSNPEGPPIPGSQGNRHGDDQACHPLLPGATIPHALRRIPGSRPADRQRRRRVRRKGDRRTAIEAGRHEMGRSRLRSCCAVVSRAVEIRTLRRRLERASETHDAEAVRTFRRRQAQPLEATGLLHTKFTPTRSPNPSSRHRPDPLNPRVENRGSSARPVRDSRTG